MARFRELSGLREGARARSERAGTAGGHRAKAQPSAGAELVPDRTGGAVILGNDPKTCDGIYPRTRDGRCQGCGRTDDH